MYIPLDAERLRKRLPHRVILTECALSDMGEPACWEEVELLYVEVDHPHGEMLAERERLVEVLYAKW